MRKYKTWEALGFNSKTDKKDDKKTPFDLKQEGYIEIFRTWGFCVFEHPKTLKRYYISNEYDFSF